MCQHMCVFISEYSERGLCISVFMYLCLNECEKISMSEKMHEDVAIY